MSPEMYLRRATTAAIDQSDRPVGEALTSVHEVAKELPAGRHLEELEALLVCHAIQSCTSWHTSCHALRNQHACSGPLAAVCVLQHWYIKMLGHSDDYDMIMENDRCAQQCQSSP